MEVGGQHHAPAALPPAKTRYPLYRRLDGPQGRSERVGKISPPPALDPQTVQPVASRYTDWAIPAEIFQGACSKCSASINSLLFITGIQFISRNVGARTKLRIMFMWTEDYPICTVQSAAACTYKNISLAFNSDSHCNDLLGRPANILDKWIPKD